MACNRFSRDCLTREATTTSQHFFFLFSFPVFIFSFIPPPLFLYVKRYGMDLLSFGPPEIICSIFRSCDDFSQVLALASACKHLHSIWTESSSSIITKDLVASMEVLSFEDALMAVSQHHALILHCNLHRPKLIPFQVRATNIVRKAYLSGLEAPQPFPFSELASSFKSPTLVELKDVLDFRHLVRCVEYMFLHGTKYGHFAFMAGRFIREDSDESSMLIFRDRFHRAMYRVFLAGAVLHRAYNEPFDLAKSRKNVNDEAFLKFSTGKRDWDVEKESSMIRYPMRTEDIEYLRKFAVYNFDAEDDSDKGRWRDEMYEAIFGPLAKYVVDDGEPRGIQKAKEFKEMNYEFEEGEYEESPFGPGVDGSAEEIMILIGAYE